MNNIIFHIGTAKTGTTYIQKTLANNRKTLADYEIAYHQIPGSLSSCHWWFALCFIDDIENFFPVRMDLARGVKRENLIARGKQSLLCVQRELENSQTVIISAEQFFGLPPKVLKKIHAFFVNQQSNAQVIVYVRDPLDLTSSMINQRVKMGLGELNSFLASPPYLHINKHIEKYISIFGREKVLVKNYTEITASKNDLVDDFICTFKPDFPLHELVRKEPVNRSICYEALLVIDEFNKSFTNYPPHSLERNLIIDVLSKVSGQKFSIPEKTIQRLKQLVSKEIDYLSESHGIDFDASAYESTHIEIDPKHETTLRSFAVAISDLIKHGFV
jgi:hypothetical protein